MNIGSLAAVWTLALSVMAPHPASQVGVSGESPSTVVGTSAPAADSSSASVAPAAPGRELTAADADAWLSGLLDYGLKNNDIAGAVVVVVKDGKVLFQQGYGWADVEKKIAMDADRSMMRIGSTSKLFTWTSVMQLVEQGKLDLDRNVDDYLDFKVSPPGRAITMRDLMNHRGGFEEGLKDVLALDPQRLQSTETYLKLHPRPLLFAPGSVPAYSNYGTALAGYIVQRVSGEAFERYVENHIFKPLGMQHSTFDQPLPQRFEGMPARGYRTASDPAQPYELVVTAPAGSMASTASDMARFMLAYLQAGSSGDARLLKPETAQLMLTPSEVADPGFGTMAHGFFRETRNGRTVVGHGGDTLFFHTELSLVPEEGAGIFVSFNSRGRDDAVYGLIKTVLDQFMDRYFPPAAAPIEPAALTSAPADALRIAGRYESSRRIEHGLLSIFYLLQQSVIRANPDGTLSAPGSFLPGEQRFQEIAPDVWQEVGGTRRLALRNVGGVPTILDSEDPTSVLQAVPAHRSAPLNLTVLLGSMAILALTLLLWPVAFGLRRHYQRAPVYAPQWRRARLLLRVAATVDLLWLIGWTYMLLPILSLHVEFYSAAHDPLIRTLQVLGLIVVAMAPLGLWCAWQGMRYEKSLWARAGNGLIALALLGCVWMGFIGGLIGFSLNY